MTTLTQADLKRNQNLLLFYFLYTTFHGALRKWVFAGVSGVNDVLFMVQLISPFIVVAFMRREKPVFSYPLVIPLVFAFTALALNPMNMTLFHGAFGFILHFGFWLLMLTYLSERDAFPVQNLIKIMIIVCIAEAFLTFVQFSLPSSHILNRYESSDDVVGFDDEGGARVIGTFSYIAGYGSLLFFTGLFIWALMVEAKKNVVLLLCMVALSLVSAFMNGSRSIMLPLVLCTCFGLASYGNLGNKIKLVAIIAMVLILGVVFNVGKQLSFVERAYTGFAYRVTSGQKSGEAESRTLSTFVEAFDFQGKYPLFGIGLGATYQGSTNKWGKSPELIEYGYCEEEPERIVVEGGYFLLFIRLGLFAYLSTQLRVPMILSVPVLLYIFFFTLFVFNAYQTAFVFFGFTLLDKVYAAKKDLQNENYS